MQFTPVTSEARDVIYCCNSNIVVCLRVASFCFLSFIYHSSIIIYDILFIIESMTLTIYHLFSTYKLRACCDVVQLSEQPAQDQDQPF